MKKICYSNVDMENAIKDNSYKIVKPGKRLLSALADFFLLFVLASGLYSVAVYPLMKLLPSYKATLNEQETHLNNCRQMYVDGKLMEYDVLPTDYINKCIKEKMADSSKDIFIHYYTVYLPTLHNNGMTYSYDVSYVNKQVYGYENQGETVIYEFDGDLSKPLKITDTAKEMINKYFNNDITKETETYYNKISNQYKASLVNAEKLLVASKEYQNDFAIVNKDNTVLYLYVSVSSTITYTLFFILFYIVLPIIFGNGQTIGKKVLKIGLYHDDNTQIRKNILVLRGILQYLTYYFMVMFIPLWQVGFAVINLPAIVFPTFTINLFILAFISLLLAIISFVVMLTRGDKQALHDKVVGVYAYRMDVQLDEENDLKNIEFKEKELEEGEE